ncbi:N-acetylmannosamine-6-phosphate 2-epimerase [Ornithinibacillus halophilus]|uniref:Putative N-acetylmannosamine-6-phosphate 2-epimerase n=1 Tax=Ornithinibacillus halophilus TaxID=930117 RepID=A0A1M5HLV9_9BACI|nr:N-acetylmannosamine-6-phosphate 2-epimerase [Ornithinibacillus halophilus]SHG16944.1 N-acylglucosamine-6-phosphate 2-epimerase [Ornithinibacillus halophilus]
MSQKLIVSCQALEDEPLHSSFIMSKMALAAYQGGASGIRANSVKDIQAIKKEVNLPIIGIIKQDYDDSEVRITPTIKEVQDLYEEGVDVIAFDATDRERPNKQTFESFFKEVKNRFPNQKFMADVSTVEEAIQAEKSGVDIVATTLVGYTPYTEGNVPLETLEEVLQSVKIPVIAEGNIDTPEKAKRALELGATAVVVGGAITRPQIITKRFSMKMEETITKGEN